MIDGAIVQKIATQAHEPGRLYVQNTQPSEDLILERNQKLRNNPGALKDLSFGRQIASVPAIVMSEWMKTYPELRGGAPSKDRQRKLMQLLSDPANRKYLVQDSTAKSATKYHQIGELYDPQKRH
ncbi:MAG: hypothetical protein PVI97_00670 [Candidatus Thiodiazotropha sp.]